MRSFTAILLLAFSLPLYVLAAHEHPRRHTGLARRAPGHVLEKRYSNARLTYYDITVGITACGNKYPKTAFVVALDTALFGTGYPGPHCFQFITLTVNGNTATAQIVDACPGCPPGGLDLTEGLFAFFAPLGLGVLSGSWTYSDGSGDNSAPPKSTTFSTPHTTSHKSPPPPPKSTTSSSPPPPPPTTSTTSTTKKRKTTTSTTPTSTSTSTTSTTSHRPPSTPSTSSTSSPIPSPTYGVTNGQSNLDGLSNLIIQLADLVGDCNDGSVNT